MSCVKEFLIKYNLACDNYVIINEDKTVTPNISFTLTISEMVSIDKIGSNGSATVNPSALTFNSNFG